MNELIVRSRLVPGLLAVCIGACGSSQALATEGGGSSYPMGAENYMTGAMPPPGLYTQVFVQHYHADRLRDDRGHRAVAHFDLTANVIAPRLIWVTEQNLFGGDLAFHVNVPLVDLKVEVNNHRQRRRGIGDIIFGPALGYHYTDRFHAIYAVDFFAPTGRYDRDDIANLGRNYWAVQPIAAFSYVDPAGLNADLKLMYDFNFRNPDTDYRSGQEAHADYSVGWAVADGWVLGMGGYIYHQTTKDDQTGQDVDANKGRVFAIGPSIKYSNAAGWFVTAKWQQEQAVRNRAEGEAYWLKLTVPL
ncbi:SphA family protein [Azotobacter beijerinckii]|uniref:SphA family protein n=1 Tax=Azotobacter beijerinckii TaxID=170623 RepID=UPI0029552AFE|nr:transporter [Azotobacter beijerinckii]MDV7212607.1 transporter [Azotobacter beijerinckii]